MLLEDGPLAHFRICSITVSSSIVDCVVLELIGLLIMLVFGFVLEPRLASIFGGGPRLFKTEVVTYQTEQMSKRASAERFFSARFAAFLFS